MATNEELNSTDKVISTDSPQTSSVSDGGAKGTDFQSTASPEAVKAKDVSVQETGQPVTGATATVEPASATPYVFGGILLVLAIAIAVFILRVKDFQTNSGASLAKSESDLPKATSKKSSAAKKSSAKKTVKKSTKKKPAAARKKRR